MEALYQILTFIFGGTSVVGTILFIIWWKQTKCLKEAEIKQKEAETELAEHGADKAEVERLHMQIEHQQKSLDTYLKIEKDLSERISEQNKALNEKKEQIRDKTDQIRKLTAQLIDSEHGRKPPNKKLTGLKYEPPKRAVK